MKLRDFAADVFLLGGIREKDYQNIKPVIRRKNRETLTLASALCGVMFAALTAASLFSDVIGEALVYYAAMMASYGVLCLLSLTLARQFPRMVLPMWYLLYLFFGAYAVLLNTVIRPQLSATTLCIFLVAAPLLIIDRPWRVAAFMAGLGAIFVVCANLLKPELAFTDSVNVLCCLFLGTAIYTYLVRIKLRDIMRARLLERQRDTDKPTGFLNKAAIETQIYRFLELPQQQGTLILIDIDNFKQVNDTYGHAFGDIVLQRTAECIRASFPEDTLCGRFGGDEFLLFLPGRDDGLAARMDGMRKLLHKEIEYPTSAYRFGISAGTVEVSREENYQTLFQKADEALYRAKREGKNRWCSYSDEDEEMKAVPGEGEG